MLIDKINKTYASITHTQKNTVYQLKSILTDKQWKKTRRNIDNFIGTPNGEHEMSEFDEFDGDDPDSRYFSQSYLPDDEREYSKYDYSFH